MASYARTGGAVIYYGQTLTISRSLCIKNTAYEGGAIDFLEGTLYIAYSVSISTTLPYK